MRKHKLFALAVLVGAFILALGGAAMAQIPDLPGMEGVVPGQGTGGVEAPAVGELGDTEHGPCVEELLNVPAIDACVDAAGRVIMDLPAVKVVSPANVDAPDAPGAPDRLPTTGANVGDIAALGLAALSGGGVLLRRLRLAIAS